jgi:hypothetical protein
VGRFFLAAPPQPSPRGGRKKEASPDLSKGEEKGKERMKRKMKY